MIRRAPYRGPFRIDPQPGLDFAGELIVDLFAGGGGASTGIEWALGRSPDIAVNHDPEAVALHQVNHPHTLHLCESVFDVRPQEVCAGRSVGHLWMSPDCRHFSKAKGSKPVSNRVRGLAWVGLRWASTVKPRIIYLENVEEFLTWGPLVRVNGEWHPCKKRSGRTFRNFVRHLLRLGYAVDWKELRACDVGAPTIRKRLFLVARCDGEPICFPEATHADPKTEAVKAGKLLPWRTAAECIDWNIPCPSIFERKKSLAENTLRRIARGILRYVIDAPEPFIVPITHHGKRSNHSIREPFKTVTAVHRGELALVAPSLTEHANGSHQRVFPVNAPLRTQCAQVKGGHFALQSAMLLKHYGGVVGTAIDQPAGTITTQDHHAIGAANLIRHFGESTGSGIADPVGTVMPHGKGKTGLVTSNLVKLKGTCRDGQRTDAPMPTICSGGTHIGEVRVFLMKYYGNEKEGVDMMGPMHTVTTKDRFGLVTVHGQPYQIADIGMRMLVPRELYRAQGFPDSYIIDRDAHGNKITITAQVRMCGNSVSPYAAAAIVRANATADRRKAVA
jgi:DNA (cytosine-5)-methyltransferase 1